MKLCRWILISVLCLFIQACASTMMAQQMQSGKMAFSEGNYKCAFHQLLPVAAYGKPQAQYAVGYMYYYGYGVPQDPESGLFWMHKAAEQGYCPAIRALALIRRGAPQCVELTADTSQNVRQITTYHTYKDAPFPAVVPAHVVIPTHEVVPVHEAVPVVHKHFQPVWRAEHTLAPSNPPPATPHLLPEYVPPVRPDPIPPPPLPEHFKPQSDASSHLQKNASACATCTGKQLSDHSRSSYAGELLNRHPEPSEGPKNIAEIPPVKKNLTLNTIAENPVDSYALQLYGAFHLKHVKNLQNELNIRGGVTRIWHTKNRNKDWYVLTYGSYSSIADARLARDELPSSVSALEPWVRKTDTLQKVG